MMYWRFAIVVLVLALAPFRGAGRVSAQTDPLLLDRAINATVQLSIVVNGTIDGQEQIVWYAVGSGTVVAPDGLILTNQHLITPAGVGEKLSELEAQLAAEGKEATLEVEPETFMVALSDGRHLPDPRYLASVAAIDADLDLAVLRIEGTARGDPIDLATLDLPVLPIGNSEGVNLGEAVHVFGFPAIGSGSLTYTTGIVSGFLFEEGIDGTAWINTDAVTSGGNSGGSAVNDAGELIGVPTSGSALDCRAGDTNRDGVIGPDDVGCVPTGGSLTQLRPIDLAKPLLASVDAAAAATIGATGAVALTPPADTLAKSLAAAEGCAARGDWRCAANFYHDALAGAPGDPEVQTALYEAYLALGRQEAAAGRLDSARNAFSGAIATDPTRADAPVALERLAPYARAIHLDGFDGARHFVESGDVEASSRYEDGAFVIQITQAGLVSGYPLTPDPLQGEDFAALLRIESAAGDGMVTIETSTDPAGGQWVFAVDPEQQTWEVLEFDTGGGQFMPWTGPHFFGRPAAEPDLNMVELRVTRGVPALLVNGVDVAALAGIPLPEIGNEGTVSFGALMASEGTEPFRVAFDEIALYELS